MAVCDTCGHDDDAAFTITRGGKTATFDSFECAIHAMAPRCARCGCRILGHGERNEEDLFCCAHCARQARDQSSAPPAASSEPVPDKQIGRWKDDGGAIMS